MLLRRQSTGGIAYATYALALDFQNSQYWKAGVQQASLAAMTGYAYTRAGTVGYDDGNSGYVSFAANVPPIIPGIGYKSHGAATNRFINSQNFTTTWAPGGATGPSFSSPSAIVTNNAAVAPDGTTTAARFQAFNVPAGKDCILDQNQATFVTPYFVCGSVWLKSANGVNQKLGAAVQWNVADSRLITVTPQWQRFFVNSNGNAIGNHANEGLDFGVLGDPFYGVVTADRSCDIYAWQGQMLQGDFPDGGPAVVTTSAAVSVGASSLSVSVPNATYSAKYYFDNGSTQTISTTVSGGAFTVPNYPTLNRPTVRAVTLI